MDRIHELTHIDRWFLDKMAHIEATYRSLESCPSLDEVPAALLREAKVEGFSDIQIGRVFGIPEAAVRERRTSLGLHPCIKQIDTLAAEFPALTSYLYLTYQGQSPMSTAEGDRRLPDRQQRGVRLVRRQHGPHPPGKRPEGHHGQLQPGNGVHRLRYL